MRAKIIFSDFDGTLRQKDQNVLTENLRAVQKWRHAGNLFVVVTGRNHAVLNQILPDWQNLIDYIIMDNGGAIFSNHDKLLYVHELQRRLIHQIQSLVCDRALPLSYSHDRCSIELMLGETAIKLRLWFKTEQHFRIYKDRIERQNWPIKVLPWIGAGFSKLPSGSSTEKFFGFLDIVPIDGGKECAIAKLVNLMNWSYTLDDIITVGDDYNDIAMLNTYRGYAIHDSPDKVITAAQGRTVTSVAHLIHSHL